MSSGVLRTICGTAILLLANVLASGSPSIYPTGTTI